MGVPQNDAYKATSHLEMDENWGGYPYFRKPPYEWEWITFEFMLRLTILQSPMNFPFWLMGGIVVSPSSLVNIPSLGDHATTLSGRFNPNLSLEKNPTVCGGFNPNFADQSPIFGETANVLGYPGILKKNHPIRAKLDRAGCSLPACEESTKAPLYVAQVRRGLVDVTLT